MSFKPDGHEKYQVSGYMKFADGTNKFRILNEPITGYVYWENSEGKIVPKGEMGGAGAKPIRLKHDVKFTNEQISAMKMFSAMVVWNYNLGKIQVLEITQVSIANALDALLDSESWGEIQGYDVIVTRTGEKKETEYQTQPEPKADLTPEVLKAYEDSNINLGALYDGEDPFANSEEVDTAQVSEALDAKEDNS